MAKDDPESWPIPVSELLARQRQNAQAEALTGEIPRVAFPRSANPVAQRASRPQSDPSAASRTASGMPSYKSAVRAEPTEEEANRVTGIIPQIDDAPTAATPQAEVPQVETPTAAVEVEPVESGPTTGSFLRTDENVDFESYRNFDDVAGGDEEPRKRKRGLFGRRKGNGDGGSGEKLKAGERARAARRATRPAGPSDAEAAAAAKSAAETVVVEPVEPVEATSAAAQAVSSVEETTALAPVEPDDVYEDQIPVVDRPLVDPLTGRFALQPAAPAPTAPRVERTVETPAIVPSATRHGTDPGTPPRSRTAEPVVGADAGAPAVRKAAVVPSADQVEADGGEESRAPRRGRRRARGDADTPVTATASDATTSATASSDTTVVDEEPLASKHSPAMQWLILAGQAIAGLVLGAAGFWGFVQLWRWNVSFALVLSAVVIFGIVTLVHLVRRRHDLATTLLALGVGLLITLGPLILLATS